MAGSYSHCVDENHVFVGVGDFQGMIENLGDAYEACEEMVFMINFLANGNKEKIEEANKAYYEIIRKENENANQ